MEAERCQRCGEPGPDLRTLWMACLYEMGELGVPFEVLKIRGTVARTHAKPARLLGHTFTQHVPIFDGDAEKHDRAFYTLRVCKGCRAEWMRAIRKWWEVEV